MPSGSPSDVRGVIETDLSDSEILSYLNDAEFEAKQAISDYFNALTPSERTQLEKYLAALRIREIRDRSINNTSRETASVTYEGLSLESLRREVHKRDPSNSLAFQRDTSRYTNSTS